MGIFFNRTCLCEALISVSRSHNHMITYKVINCSLSLLHNSTTKYCDKFLSPYCPPQCTFYTIIKIKYGEYICNMFNCDVYWLLFLIYFLLQSVIQWFFFVCLIYSKNIKDNWILSCTVYSAEFFVLLLLYPIMTWLNLLQQ